MVRWLEPEESHTAVEGRGPRRLHADLDRRHPGSAFARPGSGGGPAPTARSLNSSGSCQHPMKTLANCSHRQPDALGDRRLHAYTFNMKSERPKPASTPCLCNALRQATRAVSRLYDDELRGI